MRMKPDSAGPPVAVVQPEGWPRPSGYANGVVVPAGHALVFVAGQVAWDAQQRVVPGGFAAQFEQALANCVTVVQAAGGAASDIVRLTVYAVDRQAYLDDLPGVGQAWRRVMGRHYPAMALVQVAGLVEEGAVVEIEATAALAPGGQRSAAAGDEGDR